MANLWDLMGFENCELWLIKSHVNKFDNFGDNWLMGCDNCE
jgi:hypothetical protein